MFEQKPMVTEPRLRLIMATARNSGISASWMVTPGTFRD